MLRSRVVGNRHPGAAMRMSASERRTQLVEVGKTVFAELGYDGASVEEIAARAHVSKPIVYEHFGGKEGLYAVVVDREVNRLLEMITSRLGPDKGARQQLFGAAMAFLDYIEADPAGFRVLTRDSPSAFGSGGMAGVLADVAGKAEDVLRDFLANAGLDPRVVPLYARALIGMVVQVGTWWDEERAPEKDVVAAHLTALAYVGLSRLRPDPMSLFSDPPRRAGGALPRPPG
jgi:AcrR family transcriptional regulator